jgi:GntR family transcriptional regulator
LGAACNHASPIPLYSQIRELLRARILDGTYRSDGKMPSENEMVRGFGVSRITVRQALNDLQKEGLIFKIHGKGTFVARPKAVQNLMRLEGFGEAMAAAGHETHSQVLGHRVLHPGCHVAARLALDDKAEVMEIRRIRYLNRDPISLDVTYVPVELGRRLVKEDLPSRDVFLILEQDYGFRLDRAELRIDATLADATLAEALAVPEGSPVLRIERLTIAIPERPIDFEFLYYRGDAFQYFMMVGRRNEADEQSRSHPQKGGKT